jgi:hypothetical protein
LLEDLALEPKVPIWLFGEVSATGGFYTASSSSSRRIIVVLEWYDTDIKGEALSAFHLVGLKPLSALLTITKALMAIFS